MIQPKPKAEVAVQRRNTSRMIVTEGELPTGPIRAPVKARQIYYSVLIFAH